MSKCEKVSKAAVMYNWGATTGGTCPVCRRQMERLWIYAPSVIYESVPQFPGMCDECADRLESIRADYRIPIYQQGDE